jgi:CO dehydrogenase/acetyl-CoA synthase gamma subunit (corrinoid Fe-S protein)
MKAGCRSAGFKRPLIYAATADNVDAMGALAKEMDLPLAVKADSVEALVPLTTKLTEMGLKDLVLDPGSRESSRPIVGSGGDSPRGPEGPQPGGGLSHHYVPL